MTDESKKQSTDSEVHVLENQSHRPLPDFRGVFLADFVHRLHLLKVWSLWGSRGGSIGQKRSLGA